MVGYRKQEGCYNCQSCKCDTDVDGESDYYCNISNDIPQYSGLRDTLYDKEDGKRFHSNKLDADSINVISGRMEL